jgi:hypothetical protein
MYYLYLTLTKKALDIFNCQPVIPDDGYLYTQFTSAECAGGLCRCNEPGGIQEELVPYAIIFFCIFGLGFPTTIFIILKWNKDLIKEDQLLRAKGLGNDRISNPHSYEIRKRYAFLFFSHLISILIPSSGEENLTFSTFATSGAKVSQTLLPLQTGKNLLDFGYYQP